jgi:LmbE family N-acetylglucosaminyl deacetylase
MNTRVHSVVLCFIAVAAACVATTAFAAAAADALPPASAAILQDLHRFREMGSVLYIAAHPDDENTQLIGYLARGRYCRIAYLSVTRGDGGQNVLGPEFGAELGLIRTEELLAARRIDGGQQFFTRAIDFGFSKDYRETLSIWDKQQVVADIVRVIRTFRPDVLIARFSPEPGNTHGHHTASAVLAVEAFALAGDPKAFPDQLAQGLTPWQPKRILQNGGGGGAFQIDVLANDPVTGESFVDIARRSRSMHKTQGFGNFGGGGAANRGARPESFTTLDGDPATKDIFDGVDTTWSRVTNGGAEIGQLADDLIKNFKPDDPAASVPAILALRAKLSAIPAGDSVVDEKRRLLDRILQACLGLDVQTTTPSAEVVPGETFKLHHTATERCDVPVSWVGVRYPAITREIKDAPVSLTKDQTAVRDSEQSLPVGTPVSQPYWLREEGTAGMFRVDDATLIGRPENPPVFPVQFLFDVGGQTLVIPDEPVQESTAGGKFEARRRRLEVIPPVSLALGSEVELFAPPGASHSVAVDVTASRANTSGTLSLVAPAGWTVAPAKQPFQLAAIGDHAQLKFTVTAPSSPETTTIVARAEINGATFDTQRMVIHYDHVPTLLLQPRATFKAVNFDLATSGHTVGYLNGAGDNVAQCIEQMGYAVTPLTAADLTPEKLHTFDAVVVGVRAFNVHTDLTTDGMQALFDYANAGGTVIEQYNRPEGLKISRFAPYDLRLSGQRVTDETAAVTVLAPDHPAMNVPNKITAADFDGWVQERSIYLPSQWDAHFTPILACSDRGEAPLKSQLLIAQDGKGYFVYTGLVFFRELPAGVPGAYRLFANLLSLGK